MSHASNDSYSIPVLNQQVTLPQFAFFQVVRVKSTGEIATILGMKYDSDSQQSEDQNGEWLYLLDGLTQLTSIWWESNQLRSLDRR
ncbi:hypothetical protein [Leptolyngbya sp. NIES-2104]|uniref:hypothetical protein n=1 Tax=Leptolyngbya sp. NIES-2104 TaxID=1552121 RepID=UPI0006EC7485|nr:hypothetical protein [Leptolyngbya sp. NIES-2104]GAP99757.1 hypothetical protein NIES2104_63230 [Leptolyngbya sp. NIES-2104]